MMLHCPASHAVAPGRKPARRPRDGRSRSPIRRVFVLLSHKLRMLRLNVAHDMRRGRPWRGKEGSDVEDGFFSEVTEPIRFGGLDSTEPLTFKVYQPDRLVLGKRMEDHLRIAVCLWHSFSWPGSDVFGVGTFDRPWLDARLDPLIAARAKLDAAFEFLTKLGVPFFCFHDRDVAPEGATWRETQTILDTIVDDIGRRMADSGMRLLWGTANLFSHPRYAAGAATNPNPEIYAVAATQVKAMLEATK